MNLCPTQIGFFLDRGIKLLYYILTLFSEESKLCRIIQEEIAI
jgi:hypothetical protein